MEKTAKKKKQPRKIAEGDFVLIDYVGMVKDSGEVFDTTIEEEAKKANIYSERGRYKPLLVVVGERWVIEGLDKSLVGKKEGEEYTVEIPPEEGFGRRDSKKIVTTTIKKLRRAGYEGEVAPGMVITVNGAPAVIRAVVSGRVMLDFNPPLAGKTLKYNVKVHKIITRRKDKIKALIEKYLGDDIEKVNFRDEKEAIKIDMGDLALNKPDIHYQKRRIADDLIKYIDGIKEVDFIDKVVKEESEETNHEEKPHTSKGSTQ